MLPLGSVTCLLWFSATTSLTQGSTNSVALVLWGSTLISQFWRSTFSLRSSFCLPQCCAFYFSLSFLLPPFSVQSAQPPCELLWLWYWKHRSNTPTSHDVEMIGCALFGYPFPIAGHDWRGEPEMKGCCTAKKRKMYEGKGIFSNKIRKRNKGSKAVTVVCSLSVTITLQRKRKADTDECQVSRICKEN